MQRAKLPLAPRAFTHARRDAAGQKGEVDGNALAKRVERAVFEYTDCVRRELFDRLGDPP